MSAPNVPCLDDPYRRQHTDPDLLRAYRAHEASGRQIAVQAQTLAATMLRELLPTAHRVVFDAWEDDDERRVTLAYIRDDTGALLWHGCDFAAHPDAVGLANIEAYGGPARVHLDHQATDVVEDLLCEAYRTSAGFFAVSDEDSPGRYEANLLELVVAEAVAAGAGCILTAYPDRMPG